MSEPPTYRAIDIAYTLHMRGDLAAAETFCTDNFRCRFLSDGAADMGKCLELVQRIADAGIEIASTQSLRTFDGQLGFSLAQGQ